MAWMKHACMFCDGIGEPRARVSRIWIRKGVVEGLVGHLVGTGHLRTTCRSTQVSCTVGQRKKVTAVTFFRCLTVSWSEYSGFLSTIRKHFIYSSCFFFRRQFRKNPQPVSQQRRGRLVIKNKLHMNFIRHVVGTKWPQFDRQHFEIWT